MEVEVEVEVGEEYMTLQHYLNQVAEVAVEGEEEGHLPLQNYLHRVVGGEVVVVEEGMTLQNYLKWMVVVEEEEEEEGEGHMPLQNYLYQAVEVVVEGEEEYELLSN